MAKKRDTGEGEGPEQPTQVFELWGPGVGSWMSPRAGDIWIVS